MRPCVPTARVLLRVATHCSSTALPPSHSGNGSISREELREALSMIGVAASPAELDMLARHCDDDGEGGIDFNEVRCAAWRALARAHALIVVMRWLHGHTPLNINPCKRAKT